MPANIEVAIDYHQIQNQEFIDESVRKKCDKKRAVSKVQLKKRSIDARSRKVVYRLLFEVFYEDEEIALEKSFSWKTFSVSKSDSKKTVLIIGAGPAGLFAGLEALKKGLVPTILERGKDVQSRRRDLKSIYKDGTVDPDSNYCFGEGGAGTYSDGKLYCRTKEKNLMREVLKTLVEFGADPEILINSRPHIGSNNLPKIISAMRERIIAEGGKVLFGKRVTNFTIKSQKITEVHCSDSSVYPCESLVLATGHSARDIFSLLESKSVKLEAKPFAIGFRIEHPQLLVDKACYRMQDINERPLTLPAAYYNLAHHAGERDVYSFCMCPGGFIVPASTEPGRLVINGMSLSKRGSPYANSGFIVNVTEADLAPYGKYGALAGVALQESLERKSFEAGGEDMSAPAQRVKDFINGKESAELPDCSYRRGLVSSDLSELLPEQMILAMRESLRAFNKRIGGYDSNDGILVALESRSSSPVRIPRDSESFKNPDISNLYPAGEGSGYAGGIISAAIDGIRVIGALL